MINTSENKVILPVPMERLAVNGAEIEYQVWGNGEPVLLIPPAGVIDGLGLPLHSQPQLASRYMLINYHRRGYMGSTLGTNALSIDLMAVDVAVLLRHLGVKTAHTVGHSIGGIIALQLAHHAPNLVHSIALLEASLPMIPGGKEMLEGMYRPIMIAYQSGNTQSAMEMFSNSVFGPNWQSIVERAVPGGVEQAKKDADISIKELLAIPAWQFGQSEIASICVPMLSVLGKFSTSPFMIKGRELLHAWFPQLEDLDVASNHLLQMQDPQGVAQGLAEFFSRHPIE